MKSRNCFIALFCFTFALLTAPMAHAGTPLRIFVVSSYHPEYIWSQETAEGFTDALLKFGYLDNKEQIKEFLDASRVVSSQVTLRKAWLDTKRKSRKQEIANSVVQVITEINKFKPDIIFLGDDNAANFKQYLRPMPHGFAHAGNGRH